jgi:hypothetical protein
MGEARMRAGSRTTSGGQRELLLELDTIEHMFTLPVTDYFSEYRNYLSGIDFLLNEAKARPLDRDLRIRLRLPAHEIGPDTHERLRAALGRYCHNRIRYNANEIRSMQRDGAGAFVIGVVILALGLLLSEALRRSEAAPEWATIFLADGLFLVLAWVGMWYPMDVLVFANRPYQRENRALRRLTDAELIIEPAESDLPGRPS